MRETRSTPGPSTACLEWLEAGTQRYPAFCLCGTEILGSHPLLADVPAHAGKCFHRRSLVHRGLSPFNSNSSLNELQVTLQIVLSQVASQRDDFAALLVPGPEQAVEAEVTLVAGLFVELVENFQASVSTVANAVFVFPGRRVTGGGVSRPRCRIDSFSSSYFGFRVVRGCRARGGPGRVSAPWACR